MLYLHPLLEIKQEEVFIMAYKCAICGKQKVTGNNVSHSNRHTRAIWLPNLQNIKIIIKGVVKRTKVCTNCIKSGKITKAPKRNYQPAPAKK